MFPVLAALLLTVGCKEKKVSDDIDKCIAAVQKKISEILAKIKAALVKLFNKNAPVQPEEPEEAPVVKDEKEVGIHD